MVRRAVSSVGRGVRGDRIDLAGDGVEQLATGAELEALAGDQVLEATGERVGCGIAAQLEHVREPVLMAWCPPDPKAELASAMTTLLAGTVADHPAMAWR